METSPISFQQNGEDITFRSIHDQFASTQWGRTLNESVRYNRYRSEDMPPSEWESLLGADVNNLDHMWLSYGIARQFIRYSNANSAYFSEEEQTDILLAATIHDWGEAIVGDTSYDQKTEKQEIDEMDRIHSLVKMMWETKPRNERGRVHKVINTVIEDSTTKTGRAFNAIERIGYLRTGIRAFKLSKLPELDHLHANLQLLTNNVFLNQLPSLLQYAREYPAVHTFLDRNKEIITEALSTLPNELFNLYDEKDIEKNRSKFYIAQYAWQSSHYNVPEPEMIASS